MRRMWSTCKIDKKEKDKTVDAFMCVGGFLFLPTSTREISNTFCFCVRYLSVSFHQCVC